MLPRVLLALLLFPALAAAQALPQFSDTGPDAAAYGAAEGYPLGTRATLGEQRHFVGEYSHYDALIPARPVPRAATPSPLQRAPAEIKIRYRYRNNSYDLTDYLNRNPTTGLLILRDRTILAEHYRYARTDRDRFTSQSMAKTVLGMLIGIAVAEGRIHSIDDPAATYVPGLANTEIGRSTIRDLLHMASGLHFEELYNGHDDAARMGRDLFRRGAPGPAAAVAQFHTIDAPPGTLWHYAGLNSETLGLVLSGATGMHPAEYLAQRIWQRIGTEADASWTIDATGQEATFCCVNAVLRDWGRFGLLLANDGAWDGQQIIPRQWVIDATTAAPGSFLAPGHVSPFYGYGYQTWLLPGPRRQFAFLGIHGQTIFVDPESHLVLVHTAVRVLPSNDPAAGELRALWFALVAEQGATSAPRH